MCIVCTYYAYNLFIYTYFWLPREHLTVHLRLGRLCTNCTPTCKIRPDPIDNGCLCVEPSTCSMVDHNTRPITTLAHPGHRIHLPSPAQCIPRRIALVTEAFATSKDTIAFALLFLVLFLFLCPLGGKLLLLHSRRSSTHDT